MPERTGLLEFDRRSMMKALGFVGVASAVGSGTASARTQTPDKHGPYRENRFLVEIDGLATASFSTVELPESTIEETEYRDGNDPHTNRKLKGRNAYDSLFLERGVTDDSIALYEWFTLAEEGNVDEARRSVAVVLLDTNGQSGPRWEFRNAWPARYDAPNLDAMGNGVALESLEILHEGMERTA